MRNREAFTLTELLAALAIVGALASLLLPAVQQAREAARRSACQNHLRQIGLAVHSFEAGHAVFPAAGWTEAAPANPAGKFKGWRTILLPHLEQGSLGDRYDASVHWWESSNVELGALRLRVFECLSTPQRRAVTSIVAKPPRPALVLPHPLAAADYEALMGVQPAVNPALYASPLANRGVLFRNSATRLADITDGASRTIAVVECAARPLVYRARLPQWDVANDQGSGWIDSDSAFSLDGASADGSQQGQGPLITPRAINATNENEPYGFHPGVAGCLFADGHVAFVSESIGLASFAALATRAGGDTPDNAAW